MEFILDMASRFGGFAGLVAVLILLYLLKQQGDLLDYHKELERRYYTDWRELLREQAQTHREIGQILAQNASTMASLCKAIDKLSDKVDSGFLRHRTDHEE